MVKPEHEQRKPPIDERYRMFLRIVVVVVSFGAYYFVQRDQLPPAVFIGLGGIALGWALVDRWTLWRRDVSEMMLVGQILLGMGLLGIGLFLYFA